MNKLTDDIIVRYFYKKALASFIFLIVVGGALCAVGLREDGSKVFLLIGALFLVMAVGQFVRDRLKKITGAEVDAHIADLVGRAGIRRNALDKLCIDEADIDNARVATIYGFSAEPIETAPIVRIDEADKRVRTSTYQFSMMFFCEDKFYTYSELRSLVDKEERSFGRMWRYGAVADCFIETVERTFPINKDGTKTDKADFRYLTIQGRAGEHFCFAFEGAEDGEANALAVVDYLKARIAAVDPDEPLEEEVNPFLLSDSVVGVKGTRQTKVLNIGRIGDSVKSLDNDK